jgi:N-acetylneuraminic acid mutarotase
LLLLGFGSTDRVDAAEGTATVGSWKRAAPLRHARSAHAVVATREAIYALAGSGVPGGVLEVERFDGWAWVAETTLPAGGLNAPAAAVLDGRIYLIGGFEGLTNLPTARVHVYDPAAKEWAEAAPLPAPRGGHAAVVLEGKIHVLGGGNAVSTIPDHTVYDPATDQWTERAPLSRAKGSPAAVVFGGRIYSIGGRSGASDYGDVEVFDAAADRWRRGPRIGPRGTAGAVVYRGAIFLFGGESQASERTLNAVLRLGPKAKSWTRVSTMPTARNYARAVVLNDAVYVVGGSRSAGASHGGAGSRIVDRFHVRR